jgi:hypothetical protein
VHVAVASEAVELDFDRSLDGMGLARAARRETPMTLTTTMDCNLGCDECHKQRSGAELGQSEIAAIVQLAEVDGDKAGGERCMSTRDVRATSSSPSNALRVVRVQGWMEAP